MADRTPERAGGGNINMNGHHRPPFDDPEDETLVVKLQTHLQQVKLQSAEKAHSMDQLNKTLKRQLQDAVAENAELRSERERSDSAGGASNGNRMQRQNSAPVDSKNINDTASVFSDTISEVSAWDESVTIAWEQGNSDFLAGQYLDGVRHYTTAATMLANQSTQAKNKEHAVRKQLNKVKVSLKEKEKMLLTSVKEADELKKKTIELMDVADSVAQLEADLHTANERVAALEDEVRIERDARETDVNTVAVLTERLSVSEERVQQAESETERILEDVDTRIRASELEKQELLEQVESLNEQLKLAQQQTAESETQKIEIEQRYSEEVLQVRSEAQLSANKVVGLEFELGNATQRASEIEEELSMALSRVQDQVNELTDQLEESKQQLAQSVSEDQDTLALQTELDSVKQELEQTRLELESKGHHTVNLEEELALATSNLEQTQQQLNALSAGQDNTSLSNEQTAALQEELDNIRQELSAAVADRQTSSETILAMENKLEAMVIEQEQGRVEFERVSIELRTATSSWEEVAAVTTQLMHVKSAEQQAVNSNDQSPSGVAESISVEPTNQESSIGDNSGGWGGAEEPTATAEGLFGVSPERQSFGGGGGWGDDTAEDLFGSDNDEMSLGGGHNGSMDGTIINAADGTIVNADGGSVVDASNADVDTQAVLSRCAVLEARVVELTSEVDQLVFEKEALKSSSDVDVTAAGAAVAELQEQLESSMTETKVQKEKLRKLVKMYKILKATTVQQQQPSGEEQSDATQTNASESSISRGVSAGSEESESNLRDQESRAEQRRQVAELREALNSVTEQLTHLGRAKDTEINELRESLESSQTQASRLERSLDDARRHAMETETESSQSDVFQSDLQQLLHSREAEVQELRAQMVENSGKLAWMEEALGKKDREIETLQERTRRSSIASASNGYISSTIENDNTHTDNMFENTVVGGSDNEIASAAALFGGFGEEEPISGMFDTAPNDIITSQQNSATTPQQPTSLQNAAVAELEQRVKELQLELAEQQTNLTDALSRERQAHERLMAQQIENSEGVEKRVLEISEEAQNRVCEMEEQLAEAKESATAAQEQVRALQDQLQESQLAASQMGFVQTEQQQHEQQHNQQQVVGSSALFGASEDDVVVEDAAGLFGSDTSSAPVLDASALFDDDGSTEGVSADPQALFGDSSLHQSSPPQPPLPTDTIPVVADGQQQQQQQQQHQQQQQKYLKEVEAECSRLAAALFESERTSEVRITAMQEAQQQLLEQAQSHSTQNKQVEETQELLNQAQFDLAHAKETESATAQELIELNEKLQQSHEQAELVRMQQEERIEQQGRQTEELGRSLAQTQAELQQLQQQYTDAMSAVKRAETERVEAEGKHTEQLSQSLVETQVQVQQMERKQTELNHTIETLTHQLSQTDQMHADAIHLLVDEHTQQVHTLEGRVFDVKSQLDVVTATVATLEERASEHQTELARLVEGHLSEVNEMKVTNQSVTNESAELKSATAKLEIEMSELKTALATAHASIHDMHKETEEFSKLRAETNTLKQNLKNARVEIEELHGRIEDMNKEREEIEMERNELKPLRQNLDELKTQHKQMLENSEEEKTALEATCAELKQEVSELTVQVQEHKDTHQAEVKKSSELARDVQVRDTALAKLSAKATGLLTCIKELQRERDTARDEAMDLLEYDSYESAQARGRSDSSRSRRRSRADSAASGRSDISSLVSSSGSRSGEVPRTKLRQRGQHSLGDDTISADAKDANRWVVKAEGLYQDIQHYGAVDSQTYGETLEAIISTKEVSDAAFYQAQDDLNELQTTNDELSQKLIDTREEMESVKKELEMRVDELRLELINNGAETETAKTALEVRAQELQMRFDQLSQELTDSGVETEAVKQALEEQVQELEKKIDELSQLQTINDELSQKLDFVECESAQRQSQIEQLEQDVLTANDAIERLKQDITSANTEIERASQDVTSDQDIERLSQDVVSANTEIERLQQDVSTAHAEIEGLQQQIECAAVHVEKTEQQQQVEAVALVQADLEALQIEHESVVNKCLELQENTFELEELRGALMEARAQLQDKKDRADSYQSQQSQEGRSRAVSEGKQGRPAPALSFGGLKSELALCLELAAAVASTQTTTHAGIFENIPTTSENVAVEGMGDLRNDIDDCEAMLEQLSANLRQQRLQHEQCDDRTGPYGDVVSSSLQPVAAPLPAQSGGEHVTQIPNVNDAENNQEIPDVGIAFAELQTKYNQLQSKHEQTVAELMRTGEQLSLRKSLFGKRPQLVLSVDREVIGSSNMGTNNILSPASSAGGETSRQLMMMRQKKQRDFGAARQEMKVARGGYTYDSDDENVVDVPVPFADTYLNDNDYDSEDENDDLFNDSPGVSPTKLAERSAERRATMDRHPHDDKVRNVDFDASTDDGHMSTTPQIPTSPYAQTMLNAHENAQHLSTAQSFNESTRSFNESVIAPPAHGEEQHRQSPIHQPSQWDSHQHMQVAPALDRDVVQYGSTNNNNDNSNNNGSVTSPVGYGQYNGDAFAVGNSNRNESVSGGTSVNFDKHNLKQTTSENGDVSGTKTDQSVNQRDRRSSSLLGSVIGSLNPFGRRNSEAADGVSGTADGDSDSSEALDPERPPSPQDPMMNPFAAAKNLVASDSADGHNGGVVTTRTSRSHSEHSWHSPPPSVSRGPLDTNNTLRGSRGSSPSATVRHTHLGSWDSVPSTADVNSMMHDVSTDVHKVSSDIGNLHNVSPDEISSTLPLQHPQPWAQHQENLNVGGGWGEQHQQQQTSSGGAAMPIDSNQSGGVQPMGWDDNSICAAAQEVAASYDHDASNPNHNPSYETIWNELTEARTQLESQQIKIRELESLCEERDGLQSALQEEREMRMWREEQQALGEEQLELQHEMNERLQYNVTQLTKQLKHALAQLATSENEPVNQASLDNGIEPVFQTSENLRELVGEHTESVNSTPRTANQNISPPSPPQDNNNNNMMFEYQQESASPPTSPFGVVPESLGAGVVLGTNSFGDVSSPPTISGFQDVSTDARNGSIQTIGGLADVAIIPTIGGVSRDLSQLDAPELARKVKVLRILLADREVELQELNEQVMSGQYKRLKERCAARERRELGGNGIGGMRGVARVLPHFAMAAVAYGASMVVPVEEVLEAVLSAAVSNVPT